MDNETIDNGPPAPLMETPNPASEPSPASQAEWYVYRGHQYGPEKKKVVRPDGPEDGGYWFCDSDGFWHGPEKRLAVEQAPEAIPEKESALLHDELEAKDKTIAELREQKSEALAAHGKTLLLLNKAAFETIPSLESERDQLRARIAQIESAEVEMPSDVLAEYDVYLASDVRAIFTAMQQKITALESK